MYSKQEKVSFWPQNISIRGYFLLRILDDKGGPGNSSTPIDVSSYPTTNFRSQSAMRSAEFHGNTPQDSPTRILIIVDAILCILKLVGTQFSLLVIKWPTGMGLL